mgnify:FL=1
MTDARFWPEGDPWSFLWGFDHLIPKDASCFFLPGVTGGSYPDARGVHVEIPGPSRVAFVDLHPDANWVHPVAFAIRMDEDGHLLWLAHDLPLRDVPRTSLVRIVGRFVRQLRG